MFIDQKVMGISWLIYFIWIYEQWWSGWHFQFFFNHIWDDDLGWGAFFRPGLKLHRNHQSEYRWCINCPGIVRVRLILFGLFSLFRRGSEAEGEKTMGYTMWRCEYSMFWLVYLSSMVYPPKKKTNLISWALLDILSTGSEGQTTSNRSIYSVGLFLMRIPFNCILILIVMRFLEVHYST